MGPAAAIVLLVVVELPDRDCFNVLTKLAQATAAGRSVRRSPRKCSQKKTHTSTLVRNDEAALAKEGLVRGFHAHILVDIASRVLACELFNISYCCCFLTALDSLRWEVSCSTTAGQDGRGAVLVAEISYLTGRQVGSALGTGDTAIRIEDGSSCAAVVVADPVNVERIACVLQLVLRWAL